MPRSPTGEFTRPTNSFSQPVLGQVIDPNDADATFNAYDDALTDSLSRTGEGGMEADLDMGGFAITNTAGGDLGTMAVQNANAVAITGGTIGGLPTPTNSGDAAPKSYVDLVASGLHIHPAVNRATTAALAANTYANGASGVGATLTGNVNGSIGSIDGAIPSAGNRLLVKDEVTQSHNGAYTVTTVGDGSNPYVLTRATDADTAAEMTGGDSFLVLAGTTNINTTWVNTTPVVTMGTTSIVFAQFAAGGGNTWSVSGADIQNTNAGVVNILGAATVGTTLSMLGGNIKLNGNWLSGDGGNEGVFVSTGGNVGINHSAPGASLDVKSEVAGTVDLIRLSTTTANATSDGQRIVWYDTPDAVVVGTINHLKTGGGAYQFRFNNWDGASLANIFNLNADKSFQFTQLAGNGIGRARLDNNGLITWISPYIFYVTDYGTMGTADDAAVIQAAIDAANSAGGGTVMLPPGSFTSGHLNLKANVWLRGQGMYGTQLNAKASITDLIGVTGLRAAISDMTLNGNATSRWGIYNNPGNPGSLDQPTEVSRVFVANFTQSTGGGITSVTGTINVDKCLLQANYINYYSYDGNIGGRFTNSECLLGGQGGFSAIWTNHGNSNEGQIIQNNQFVGCTAEGVNIGAGVLIYFQNNVIDSAGARDLVVDGGRSIIMTGNYTNKAVAIASLTASWFMQNSIFGTVTISGGQILVMFNQFNTTVSIGAGPYVALNTGGSGYSNSTTLPASW